MLYVEQHKPGPDKGLPDRMIRIGFEIGHFDHRAVISGAAPPSTSLFAITVSPVAGESCYSARCHKLLGRALTD